jgi:hypothetical protein
VLHHAEARELRQHPAEVTERLAIPLPQGVEELATAAVGERLEDGVVVGLRDPDLFGTGRVDDGRT